MTQYRARLAPDDEQARQQVIGALNQQAQARLREDLRKELFAKNDVVILLDPPRVEVALGEGTPMRGPLTAPVVLVEYTDFQCPYCTRIQPTIDALRERYGDQLLHVFKNLPLPMHAQAQLAGEAALCAQDQDKFWEFHDWLFENQRNLSQESMVAQAGVLELDTELFAACIDQKTYTEKVKDDMKEARSFGFTGTPGFLINGRAVTGAQPIEAFEVIIDEELTLKGIEIPPRPEAEAAEAQEETAQ
jgi:protein-disulfide isomerase